MVCREMLRWASALGLVLSLVGCAAWDTASSPDQPASASTPGAPATSSTAPASGASAAGEDNRLIRDVKKQGQRLKQEGSDLVDVAVQPVHDLNLIDKSIPPVLVAARTQGAYAPPADTQCSAILDEIRLLDNALGADIDAPAGPASADPSLAEKALDRAVDYVVQPAVNTVRASVNYAVEGVLPFRSWVRRLSGAERLSEENAAAISAGTTRRTFLKGWVRGAGCALPPPSVVRVAPASSSAESPAAETPSGASTTPSAPAPAL